MSFAGSGFSWAVIVGASAILSVGVFDDLRSKKFHNWLFIVCCVVAAVVVFSVNGFSGLLVGSVGFLAGFALLTPLVLMKVVGAGDMKLIAAFGLMTNWTTVLSVIILAFLWGAIFGVIRAVIRGQGMVLLRNMIAIVKLSDRTQLELQRMPFAVAIFMGWLSHLVYEGVL